MSSNQKKGTGHIIFGVLGFLLIAVAGTAVLLFLANSDNKDNSKDKESSTTTAAYFKQPDEDKVIDTEEWGEAPSNEIIIGLKDGYTKNDADEIAKSINGEVVGEIAEFNLFQIQLTEASEITLSKRIRELENNEYIDIALPNVVQYSKEIKSIACSMYEDSYAEGDFGIPYKMIGVEKAWKYLKASGVNLNEVKIGIVDDGLNTKFIDDGSDVKLGIIENKDARDDSETHGTDIANIIGGTWENGGTVGIAGGLEDKLTMQFSNVFTGQKYITKTDETDSKNITQTTYKGNSYIVQDFVEIKKQIDAGSTVINYSIGPAKPDVKNKGLSILYKKFLQKVAKKYPKVVFVTSAGNANSKLTGENYSMAGLSLPNVITVGGLDNQGNKADHSNISTGSGEVTLATSSTDIPNGLDTDGKLFTADGTSFAAPQVTASVAILQSINPKLTATEIKDILVKTADSSISDTAITKNEKQIPTGLGGKVLRLDQAVLETLKGLPPDQRPENISEEYFTQLSTIAATAISKPDDSLSYDISAILEAIQKDGTTITINSQGDGLIGGMSSQQLNSAGSVEWVFSFPESEDPMDGVLLITRLDSKACTRLFLKSSGGSYTGQGEIPLPKLSAVQEGLPKIKLQTKINIVGIEKVTIDFSAKDTVPVTDETGTTELQYTMTGSTTGTINSDGSISTKGTFALSYSLKLLPNAAKFLGVPSLDDKFTGTAVINGNLDGDNFIGTITLPDENPPITGSIKATR